MVEAARNVADKYNDYKAALAAGYKIFLPNLPQKQYHFTNYWMGSKPAGILIPSILLRCSTKRTAMTTG